jgi:asparagine synthase (glutamine-hydrolysing)
MFCIFALYDNEEKERKIPIEKVVANVLGPDNTHILFENKLIFGFQRYVSYNTSQPFASDNTISLCSGNISNSNEVRNDYGLICYTDSDCETILQLYERVKRFDQEYIESMILLCNALDGKFAFIIYDKSLTRLVVARDRHGQAPLFFGFNDEHKQIGFASELQAISELFDSVIHVEPSSFIVLDLSKEMNITKYNY